MNRLQGRLTKLEGRTTERGPRLEMVLLDDAGEVFLQGFIEGRWVAWEDVSAATREMVRDPRHSCKFYAGFDPEAV